MTGTYFWFISSLLSGLIFKKNAWGRYALLLSLLLCTVTFSRFSTQRPCDIPVETFYRYSPCRMKSSSGVSPNLWFKSSRSSGMWCNRRSESPVNPSVGAACSAVVYRAFVSHPLTCTGPPFLPCRTGLAGRVWNILEHLRYFFYKSEMYVLTYVHCTLLYIYFLKLFCFCFSGLWRWASVA